MGSLNVRQLLVLVHLLLVVSTSVMSYPVDTSGEENGLHLPPDTEAGKKLSRKDLCPPGKTSSSFRYHNATKMCYKLGEKGPCGLNSVFHSDVNSTVFGECDCNFFGAKVPLVYHPQSDQCYQVYTQAYCEPNQWLTFSNNLDPTCVLDKCGDAILFGDPDDDDAGDATMVDFNGKCVQLNARNSACKPDQIVTFLKDQVVPGCGRVEDSEEYAISMRSVYKTVSLSCKPGSRRDVHGKCRRAITIQSSSAER